MMASADAEAAFDQPLVHHFWRAQSNFESGSLPAPLFRMHFIIRHACKRFDDVGEHLFPRFGDDRLLAGEEYDIRQRLRRFGFSASSPRLYALPVQPWLPELRAWPLLLLVLSAAAGLAATTSGLDSSIAALGSAASWPCVWRVTGRYAQFFECFCQIRFAAIVRYGSTFASFLPAAVPSNQNKTAPAPPSSDALLRLPVSAPPVIRHAPFPEKAALPQGHSTL